MFSNLNLNLIFILKFFFFVFFHFSNAAKNYSGYNLVQIIPENLEILQKTSVFLSKIQADFWSKPNGPGKRFEVLVEPENFENLRNFLLENRIHYEILVDDLEKLIQREKAVMEFNADWLRDDSSPLNFNFDRYHSYDELSTFFQSLPGIYPKLVKVFNAGNSLENRALWVVQIGDSVNDSGRQKPAIWIDAGIHAREWISQSTALVIINELISGYQNNDPTIRHYVNNLDWFIMPMANPDGYEFSRNQDRLWRKNRNPNGNQTRQKCQGVDLNRNFDWYWSTYGSSFDSCTEIYHGISAFSEPETRAIRDAILKIGPKLESYVSFHSYSQLWSFPFGHKPGAELAEDWRELKEIALEGAKQIKSFYGTDYVVETLPNFLYASSGTSLDWAKGRARVKYSYGLELRPANVNLLSSFGFLLPESQIIPTGKETFAGMKVVADAILKRNGLPPVPGPNSLSPATL